VVSEYLTQIAASAIFAINSW